MLKGPLALHLGVKSVAPKNSLRSLASCDRKAPQQEVSFRKIAGFRFGDLRPGRTLVTSPSENPELHPWLPRSGHVPPVRELGSAFCVQAAFNGDGGVQTLQCCDLQDHCPLLKGCERPTRKNTKSEQIPNAGGFVRNRICILSAWSGHCGLGWFGWS